LARDQKWIIEKVYLHAAPFRRFSSLNYEEIVIIKTHINKKSLKTDRQAFADK
jgi:hypothetical protein